MAKQKATRDQPIEHQQYRADLRASPQMIELHLQLLGDSPTLTFIFFVASAILAMVGFRFTYYAYRNRSGTEIQRQTPIWSYLVYIGLLAGSYGVAGIVDISTALDLGARSGLLLGTTLLLAFAVRQIHDTATSADGESSHTSLRERSVRTVFGALVLVDVVVVFVAGQSELTATLEGLSAIAFVAYGFVFFRDRSTVVRLQGTMLDSLVRHLLPVLTFIALVSMVNLAIPFGLERVVVLHVQVVFIIMAATALMMGTIKLRQNLASL